MSCGAGNTALEEVHTLRRTVAHLVKEVDFMKEQIAYLDRYKADASLTTLKPYPVQVLEISDQG